MTFSSRHAILLRWTLPAAATCALLAGDVAFAKPPQLGKDYFGTYQFDDLTSSGAFTVELGKQSGKEFSRIDIEATNFAQFEGDGHLAQKNTVLIVKTQGYGGGGAPRMNLRATLLNGGTQLDGTFKLKRKNLPVRTGTFTVSR